MAKKIEMDILFKDFKNWVDREIADWTDEERYECIDDGGPIVDDDRELARFLVEYPKYDFDILYANLDDLNEIVRLVALRYKEDDM